LCRRTATDGGYKPRGAQELKQIDTLVKSAIGYDSVRGDQVQSSTCRSPVWRLSRYARADAAAGSTKRLVQDHRGGILSITALLIGLFVMRPLIARMFARFRSPRASGQIGSGTPAVDNWRRQAPRRGTRALPGQAPRRSRRRAKA